ncbi:MAG: hypothetical protein AAF633_14355 [Chloroflexota bacterium]
MAQNNDRLESSLRRQRQAQRRMEQRVLFSYSSLFALGLAIGLSGALYFAWRIYPLNPPVGTLADFLPSFKEEYVYMVSQQYAETDDWETANQYLIRLNDPAIDQYAVQQLDNYLRSGRSADAVRDMARLAQALGAEGQALDIFAPTPISGGVIEILPSPSPTLNPAAESPIATPTLLPSPTPILPATPIFPTETPIRPESGPFLLQEQEVVCHAELTAPRIEVIVLDENGEPLPAIEVLVRSDGQEDRFITGFKPEFGLGYGDVSMEADRSYAITLAEGSDTVSGLQIEICADQSGNAGWRLVFQKNGED